ncbi:methyltransferase domain-containing protein [uncultured Methylibium sp.]|uniref:class I SAM-dependent methyltransferase n=1 Tax=uncultured Methylibium sp. TaxID=381093 RepID=UPI0025E3E712|nr:methyltransferase domain-containing protein [uncultured Methylibium sp.]
MSSARDIDDYQRAYAASDFEPTQALMRKRMLLELLARWQPRRLLEVGCGSDPLFAHYRDFDRFCVVEPGAGFAQQATATADGDARVHVVQAFMEDAAGVLAAERFDCILLSGLLHEVPDCQPLLAAVASLCGPDTRVHVNVPNARSLHRLLALEMGLITELHELSANQRSLQQPRTFDLDILGELCRRCGFEVQESGSYFVKPFTHRQMAQLQGVGLLDERMLSGLYGLERHVPGLGSEIFVNLRCTAPRPA